MNEANSNDTKDESADDPNGADELTLVGGEEHLATNRLPPLPRPPSRSSASHPPPAAGPKAYGPPSSPPAALPGGISPLSAAPVPAALGSSHSLAPPAAIGTATLPGIRQSADARQGPREARASWWNALLPGAAPAGYDIPPFQVDVRVAERKLAAIVALTALVVVLVAIALGLRVDGSPAFESPLVVAAAIVARALVSLGMLAFGLVLLRFAERLYMRS